MKEYGVGEDVLFNEDDLLDRSNIPRVARCIKQIAIIVSILLRSDPSQHTQQFFVIFLDSLKANAPLRP